MWKPNCICSWYNCDQRIVLKLSMVSEEVYSIAGEKDSAVIRKPSQVCISMGSVNALLAELMVESWNSQSMHIIVAPME